MAAVRPSSSDTSFGWEEPLGWDELCDRVKSRLKIEQSRLWVGGDKRFVTRSARFSKIL
jgi:hypothetical protein